MTYLTDDLLAAIRREHHCSDCSGRYEPAGDEAANLPVRAGGGATPPASPIYQATEGRSEDRASGPVAALPSVAAEPDPLD